MSADPALPPPPVTPGFTLRRQRCRNHEGREAVARCPSCGRFFCRECVTEHEGRILCAPCLARNGRERVRPPRRRWMRPVFTALAGFVALWFVFQCAGQLLLSLPSEFHEGVIWQGGAE